MEIVWDEEAVFANEFVVEIDFTAAKFRGLNEDKIPVNGGVVAVWRILVAASWCEMDAAADFFVEKNVFHWLGDVWVNTNAQFPDITCAVVCVENDV